MHAGLSAKLPREDSAVHDGCARLHQWDDAVARPGHDSEAVSTREKWTGTGPSVLQHPVVEMV